MKKQTFEVTTETYPGNSLLTPHQVQGLLYRHSAPLGSVSVRETTPKPITAGDTVVFTNAPSAVAAHKGYVIATYGALAWATFGTNGPLTYEVSKLSRA